MKVWHIADALEQIAPPACSAQWDNVGLLLGDGSSNAGKLMLCIDLTQEVLAEARAARAEMIMAYHPIIFKPVARITAKHNPVLLAAARAGVSVYSMHTALDATRGGTNDVLADAIGISADDRKPLEPLSGQLTVKIVAFVPNDDLAKVADAAFSAGAGRIGNYERCAFFTHGIGTFMGGKSSTPTIGQAGRQEAAEEIRLEVIAPAALGTAVAQAIRDAHSYEEPAIDIYPLAGCPYGLGMGRVGKLESAATAAAVIARVKKAASVKKAAVAWGKGAGAKQIIRTAACGAGAAGAMYQQAISAGAELFVTGEMRHHDALAASAAGMTVVCLGHSNSERMTLRPLAKRIQELLPKLKIVIAKSDADPFEIE